MDVAISWYPRPDSTALSQRRSESYPILLSLYLYLHQQCVTTKHGIQRLMSLSWFKSGRLPRWVPTSNWCVPPNSYPSAAQYDATMCKKN